MGLITDVAWRSLWRQKRRTFLTAFTMSFGVAITMLGMSFVDGMYGQMRDVMVTRQLGHIQIHHTEYVGKRSLFDTVPNSDELVKKLDTLPGVVAVSPRMLANGLAGTKTRTEGAQLFGVIGDRENKAADLKKRVESGKWLDELAPTEVVIGFKLAEKLEAKLGDEIVVVTQASDGSSGNALYTIGGLLNSGSPILDKAAIYFHIDQLRELVALPDQAHEIVVIGPSDATTPVQTIKDLVVQQIDPKVTMVRTWWEVSPQVSEMLATQSLNTFINLFFIFGVTGIGVVNTMLMSVFERTREFGVLRALGVRQNELVRMVLLEGFFLGILAASVGMIVGSGLVWYMATFGYDMSMKNGEGFKASNIQFEPIIYARYTWQGFVYPAVSALVTVVLAAVWPSVRAARLQPIDALRSE